MFVLLKELVLNFFVRPSLWPVFLLFQGHSEPLLILREIAQRCVESWIKENKNMALGTLVITDRT
jgi:hypothetical protein